MELSKGTDVFNLWDTNGRRADVVNALGIYLRILKQLKESYPSECWAAYPKSLLQYRFYFDAIKESPDVFKSHDKADEFQDSVREDEILFFNKDSSWIEKVFPSLKENLDVNIEKRARHYTSNLVRLGLANQCREITDAGYSFLKEDIDLDSVESMLPLSKLNIVILRQLLKFKIYTPEKNGERMYYSPFLMAIYLLLHDNTIDSNVFRYTIQSMSPWRQISVDSILAECKKGKYFVNIPIEIPNEFKKSSKVSKQDFLSCINNRKSDSVVEEVYYPFYDALFEYKNNSNDINFKKLIDVVTDYSNSPKIKKAFGYGDNVFLLGNSSSILNHKDFIERNKDNRFLNATNLNEEFFCSYFKSKYIDSVKEYSDTTLRLLSASGLFRFGKALPEISYKVVLSEIFKNFNWQDAIFGKINKTQYESLEKDFVSNCSFKTILKVDDHVINGVINNIPSAEHLDVRTYLENQNRSDLEKHVEEKYKKDEIVKLLRMFSDRTNDAKIKSYVNVDATVPTIYEYVVAIAWYYISEKRINLYDSLRLTLNGDFEPMSHASGGDGDIIVNYQDKIVMLEVTLMNKSAQKRGEWEPVLRHSINLKANTTKEVTTLFVADELDYNTINIWRAVAAVPLQSSNSSKLTNRVIIMPFTNQEIVNFLEKSITDKSIIDSIRNSYGKIKSDFDSNWREEIMTNIHS